MLRANILGIRGPAPTLELRCNLDLTHPIEGQWVPGQTSPAKRAPRRLELGIESPSVQLIAGAGVAYNYFSSGMSG